MKIAGRSIGTDAPPLVIAEMSGNHNQSLDRALAIVEAAAAAGAHALKIQTYTPDTMTLDIEEGDFFISDDRNPWRGKSLHELYRDAYTPWDWHSAIFKRANELGMIAFSTPFDETSIEFLESLDVPCYKIASFENTDLPLVRRAAATGKPLIVSTGMANLAQLGELVDAIRAAGGNEFALLKCTSTYPAMPTDSNLRTIPHLRDMFGCEVGLSDHTMGIGVAVTAVALGATVIEKHFTLKRADGGVDAAFSLEPDEMCALVTESDRAWQALGNIYYGPTNAEASSIMFKRSLYVSRDMKAGDLISPANVRSIRPGHGLPPKLFDVVCGMRICKDVKRGRPLTWDLFRE